MLREIPRLPLPDPARLDGQDQEVLLANDAREISNPDRLERLDYRERLHLVLAEVGRDAPAGSRVVDVGSAQGNLGVLLARAGYQVTTTDLRVGFLRYGRLKLVSECAQAVACSGDHLPLCATGVDVVVLGELLEHVAHPDAFLEEAARVLRPGGMVVVTTPNGQHRWSGLPTWTAAQTDLAAFEQRQFGPDGGDHLFLYRPDELAGLMAAAGFSDVRVRCFYSDVSARAAARIRGLPGWARAASRLSPILAETLHLADTVLLSVLAAPRLSLGLVAVGHRP